MKPQVIEYLDKLEEAVATLQDTLSLRESSVGNIEKILASLGIDATWASFTKAMVPYLSGAVLAKDAEGKLYPKPFKNHQGKTVTSQKEALAAFSQTQDNANISSPLRQDPSKMLYAVMAIIQADINLKSKGVDASQERVQQIQAIADKLGGASDVKEFAQGLLKAA